MKHVTSVHLFLLITMIILMSNKARAQSFTLLMDSVMTSSSTTKSLSSESYLDKQSLFVNNRELLNYLKTTKNHNITIQSGLVNHPLSLQAANLISDQSSLFVIDPFGIHKSEMNAKDFNAYYGSDDHGELVISTYKNSDPYGYWKEGDIVIEFDNAGNKEKVIKSGNAIKSIHEEGQILGGSCQMQESLNPIFQDTVTKEDKYKNTENKIIEITLVLDAEFISKNGGKESALAKALGILNSVHTNFDGEFSSDLSFKVKDVVLSDCENCDPWSAEENIGTLLLEVNDWAMSQSYLNANDAILFWSGRDFEGDAIGSAYNGALCSDVNTIVLQDLTEGPWALRVLAAHELGHTLNSDHDHMASPTIMAPALTNSNNWSSGSINAINSFIQTEACLEESSTVSCPALTDIEAVLSITNNLNLTWDIVNGASYSVTIINVLDQSVVFEQITNFNMIDVDGVLSGCEDYRVIVTPSCAGNTPLSTQILISTKHQSEITISNVVPSNCYIEEGQTRYDLSIDFYNPINNKQVSLQIGDEIYDMTLFIGNYNYEIKGIEASGALTELILNKVGLSTPSCVADYSYKAPGQDCALDYEVDFNDCLLPDGWEVSSAGSSHVGYQWTAKGTDRDILNYGNSQNSYTTKTIDGTCMMIIDDDLVNTADHSGITWITSQTLDLDQYDQVSVGFDFVFDAFLAKGENGSYLKAEVWNGETWIEIFSINQSACLWYAVWTSECIQRVEINVGQFRNSEFKLRWIYSDGGDQKWTGMAALDNITINASQTVFGPCGQDEYQIVENSVMADTLEAKMIYVKAPIQQSSLSLRASSAVIMEPGVDIGAGVSFSVEIFPCIN